MDDLLRNKQKKEAIKRLKILQDKYGMCENVLEEFQNFETIYYSENLGGFYKGILYWLSNEEKLVKEVEEFEKDNQAFVYHCILNHTEFGDLLDMLYVSNDEENWQEECDDLQESIIYIYASNLLDKFNSEFGAVCIKGVNGGLCRE